MSKSSTPTFIVIRRNKKGGHGHHGGAWKIAYADFVTAMMAFFLLMWLLSSVTKAELSSVETYFRTPLKVALFGGAGSGDQSSILQGSPALKQNMPQPNPSPSPTVQRQRNIRDESDDAALNKLKQKIAEMVETNPVMSQFKHQLLIDMTTEGLRIQIVDQQNRPMFANASAEVQPYMRTILRELGTALNDVPNPISLSGHTDATQYATQHGYSNWELSADRANASRRELVAGGMKPEKVSRVVGLEASVPLDKANIYNPINRRISIVVLNARAAEAVRSGGVEPVADLRNDGKDTLTDAAARATGVADAVTAAKP